MKSAAETPEAVSAAILLTAKNASEAIKRLYTERKRDDKSCTFQAICDAAGISSTGYLSDVVNGRRRLHLKYRRGIAKAFHLKGPLAQCLSALAARDLEDDEAKRLKLDKRISLLRKAIRFERPPLAGGLREFFLAVEVFCAFGLFKNQPCSQDIVGYFGSEQGAAVESSLLLLERLGAVALQDDETYRIVNDNVLYSGKAGGSGLTHIDFLKLAMSDAMANVERRFPAKSESHFGSSIISVRTKDFRTKLKKLKTSLLLAQADLESGDADLLVRFNVQIYPLERSTAKRPQ